MVPEIHEWKRHEAFRDNGYGYYEDFDSRSGSFDYDDPRDYHEWDDCSDIEEVEGYYDPFPDDRRTILSLLVVRRCWL